MGNEAMEVENYSKLKDLRVEIEREEGSFSLCFWIFLTNSTTFPLTILHKVSNCPFIFSLSLFHLFGLSLYC